MKRKLQVRDWGVPLVAAVLVAGVGWLVNRAMEHTLKRLVREQIQTVLNADVTALRQWFEVERDTVEEHANRQEVREAVIELAARERGPDAHASLLADPAVARLRRLVEPVARYRKYLGFAVVDRNGVAMAAGRDEAIGRSLVLDPSLLTPVFAKGEVLVTPPVAAASMAEGSPARQGAAAIIAAAPVTDDAGRIVGSLGFAISVARFTDILRIARSGDTGETYAFDAKGRMLSDSRFDDQLRHIGLLPRDPGSNAVLNVDLRDPGGNLLRGHKPAVPRAEQPLTRMAAAAVAGREGTDVDGYRDYRGVPVVGAWTWLPDKQIGVATEVDVSEAFAAAAIVRQAFWGLFGLLVLAAGAMFVSSNTVRRLRREVAEAQQLGQYRLEEKVGEGGIGTVYRARHGLLRRPTAIKVLHDSEESPETLRRFEREVQVTSQLTHPNTIAVYDFGHTPAGVFYYAMEYLQGATIARCVELAGAQPAGRVIHILMQACGSLAEAHAAGMIHRDIKPANLMLCERGGLLDFVKVLDFGLVRPVEQTEELALTNVKSLTGTPLYLSPDLIQAPDSVDARSDVYQLGAVAYYLLTGTHVFRGVNIYEVCAQHLHTEPEPPATRLGRPVASDLAGVILRCLAKDGAQRPASAEALLAALASCADAGTWTQADARAWWLAWGDRLGGTAVRRPGEDPGSPSVVHIDLGARRA